MPRLQPIGLAKFGSYAKTLSSLQIFSIAYQPYSSYYKGKIFEEAFLCILESF